MTARTKHKQIHGVAQATDALAHTANPTGMTSPISLIETDEAPKDLLRSLVQSALQDVIREEFNQFLGSAPYERTEERTGYRNGSYQRSFKTRVGNIALEIPRDRAGNFSPTLFEKYERSEQAFMLAMIEMYFQGVSTRKITKVVEELCGTSVSASTISNLTRKLDVPLEAWRRRTLREDSYRYLLVDAHYEDVRREGQVLGTAALWVVGITDDGYREHLGVWSGAAESTQSWGDVFGDLVQRGLKGVGYVVSDEHKGLVQAIRRYFPDAIHQRCQVHYLRNAMAYVTSDTLIRELRQGVNDAWAAPTREESIIRFKRLVESFKRQGAVKLANWMEDTYEETLGFYHFDHDRARIRLRSTNAIENHHCHVRRRTSVIRIFPHEGSLIRLLTAMAMDQNEKWRQSRYINFPRHEHIATVRPMRQIA